MSNPLVYNPGLPDTDTHGGLMSSVADQLVPLFTTVSDSDIALARRMALSALQAYAPATPADYINVARTIAFSMSALALLGHAAGTDIPMTEKMRMFGRANALNRSADQSERTMMQRHRHLNTPGAAQTAVDDPGCEAAAPLRALDDATVEAAVAEAMGIYGAVRQMVEPPAAAAQPAYESVPRSRPLRPAHDVMQMAPPAAPFRYDIRMHDADGARVTMQPDAEQSRCNATFDAV